MINFLNSQGVMADVRVGDKKTLLTLMAGQAAKITGIHERVVLDAVIQREKLGSTGVGKGIAIPHARLKDCPRVVGLFAQVHQPIAFDALDDQPVDLVFMLLSPDGAGADHLQALAAISRLLRDGAVTERLRGATSADALLALLTQGELAKAA
ncbi:MAG TPA: transcriptional regulator [Rhodospirillaceae bacterium]|nr:transcriptional regulator [Rhodospirillaceae bacterium]